MWCDWCAPSPRALLSSYRSRRILMWLQAVPRRYQDAHCWVLDFLPLIGHSGSISRSQSLVQCVGTSLAHCSKPVFTAVISCGRDKMPRSWQFKPLYDILCRHDFLDSKVTSRKEVWSGRRLVVRAKPGAGANEMFSVTSPHESRNSWLKELGWKTGVIFHRMSPQTFVTW